MTKLEIFDDIVSIMAKDSATSKDKGAGHFESYRKEISENMPSDRFMLVVQRYLASFCVPSHLYFGSRVPVKRAGFAVRRIDDTLHVVNAEESLPVAVGDRVVALDGMSIPQAAEKYRELLYGETNERQRWHSLLPLFAQVTVENASGRSTFPMPLVEKRTERPPYVFQQINDSTVLLRFDDFTNEGPIHALIHAHEREIADAENLIVDVRNNAGGSDLSFLPLLDYCFAEGDRVDWSRTDAEINYSERNVDTRIAMFEEYLKGDVPPEVRKILNGQMDSLKAYRGKGYYRSEDSGVDLTINGTRKPEHVYVLSDVECGSSGDSFVEMLRSSSKVTVVGRPTDGILDYSNLSFIFYDDYQFGYPTSRRLALDKGIAMGGHGVPVDVYIPFTEEEVHRDVIMDWVLDRIKQA